MKERHSPCLLCLSSFNTEYTERLSVLCVEPRLATECMELLVPF
jgi:hypothetical protein